MKIKCQPRTEFLNCARRCVPFVTLTAGKILRVGSDHPKRELISRLGQYTSTASIAEAGRLVIPVSKLLVP